MGKKQLKKYPKGYCLGCSARLPPEWARKWKWRWYCNECRRLIREGRDL